MTDVAGSASVDALASAGAAHGYGTSQADVDAYADAAGQAGGAAACVAIGAAAAAPLCGIVGGKVGAAIANAVQSLGSAIFGSSPQPDAGDVFNPIADRVIAGLVLLAQKKPHDAAAVHALGESGIRALMKLPDWVNVASHWAVDANAFNAAHSKRRAGTALQWFYDGSAGGQAGRIRGAVAAAYGNGPDDRADISRAMVAAAAETSTWIAANQAGVQLPAGMFTAIAAALEQAKRKQRARRALFVAVPLAMLGGAAAVALEVLL